MLFEYLTDKRLKSTFSTYISPNESVLPSLNELNTFRLTGFCNKYQETLL